MKTVASIPVVSGLPIAGSLFAFRRDRLGLQRKIFAECGDIGVFQLGSTDVLMVSSAELAQQVLVEKDDAFMKSPGLRTYTRPLLGNGILIADREVHRRQRKLMASAFQHKRIASYAKVMSEYTERTLRTWSPGQVLDAHEEMMRLTLEIVGKTLFDTDVGSDAKEIGEALETAMRYTMESVAAILHPPLSWPTPRNVRTRRAIARLDRIIYRIIQERRASGRDTGDVLSMLLLARDEDDGSGMDDLSVRDEAMTLMLAGHETTANALAFSWYLLAKNPRVAEKLGSELDRVLGDRAPTFEDLPQLPYALQILKETMRLYPPAYIMGRQAIRDVTIGEYELPKDTIVMINIYAMHRRGDVFPDPERFDPDRFETDAEKKLPRGAFMPFGAGSRVCIGNHFALMEGQIVLAAIARRFALDLVSSGEPQLDPLITLRPKHGIPMRVRERRAVSAPHAARAREALEAEVRRV